MLELWNYVQKQPPQNDFISRPVNVFEIDFARFHDLHYHGYKAAKTC